MRLNTFARSALAVVIAWCFGHHAAAQYASTNIGNPAVLGSSTPSGNGYTVSASGTNIAGNADQFFFNYRVIAGDFDLKIRVDAMSHSDVWAKAGLMARETLTPSSRHVSAFASPSVSGCFLLSRTSAAGNSTNQGTFPVGYPNTWLRLKRAGSVFTGYAGLDGQNWAPLGSVTLTSPSNSLFVGMAVNAANASQTATAEFRDEMDATGGNVGGVVVPFEPIGPSSRNTGLIISEIMYHPKSSNDLEFIEICNASGISENLGGWRISGDVDYVFPPGTVIQPGQFLVVARYPSLLQAAYGISGVLGPWEGNKATGATNALPDDEGTIRLRHRANAVLLEVNYLGERPWPIAADGAGHSLVLVRASYGEADPRAWLASDSIGGSPGRAEPVSMENLRPVVINEFLAHTDDPLFDYIELYNHSNQSVDISGAYLSDDRDTNKFRIPNGTVLGSRGFAVFDQNQLGFSLSSGGERIYLVNSNQTRVIDAIVFEPQANSVSSGRYPDGAPDFHELSTRTPGATNSALLIRDVVINELMFHPISDKEDDEYLELYNRGAGPVDVSNWRFTDGIDFRIPPGSVIAPNGYLVIARNLTNLLAKYSQLNLTNAVGNYDGALANGGERIALAMPDYFLVTNATVVATQANYIVMDEVTYIDSGRWTQWADGGGSSLELIDPASDNRSPANWVDSDETLKSAWTNINHREIIDNTYPRGAPGSDLNEVQLMILGAGEVLVDDLEVHAESPTTGPNLVANGTFATGTNGWILQGNHVYSRLEPAGPNNPSASLRILASAGGDNGANRVETDLTTSLSVNNPASIRANARWLRGHPDLLLRLHGGGIEPVVTLPLPNNLGTPGQPNSRRLANAGPAITDVTHSPVLPAANQPVIVTARLRDPDGLGTVQVQYRQDPSPNLNNVALRDDGTGGDAVAGDGTWSGTIPGLPAGTLVAFRIQASDARTPTPASTLFPPDAVTAGRECLIRFGDAPTTGNIGAYRLWMTSSNMTGWINRELFSNQAQDGTFVYNNYRAIYNAGARYRGSPFIRPSYSSPTVGSCGYVWIMPEDDALLGQDELNLDSLEPGGRDSTALREITSFTILDQLDYPFSYQRFVHVIINGINNTSRGIPVYTDSQQPNSSYIASWFPDDSDGEIFKIDDWFEFTDSPVRMQVNKCANLENFTTPNPTGSGLPVKKQARYRWNWEKKFNRTLDDDYTSLYRLADALVATDANYVRAVEDTVDIEEWLTTAAFRHVVGDWDGYGYNRGKNQFTYRAKNGKFCMLQWDLDFALGCTGGHSPSQDLFSIALDGATGQNNMPEMARMYNHPHFRRIYLQALLRMANGPLQDANFLPILDARYRSLQANGVNPVSPYVASGAQSIGIDAWLRQRRTHILNNNNGVAPYSNATFRVTSPLELTTNINLVTITGSAPLGVYKIVLNGMPWQVTWTSVTTWVARVVLDMGTNTLVFNGLDRDGHTNTATFSVKGVFTGNDPSPLGLLTFNEILYDPRVPEASFVELLNRASVAFDLSGWRINGLDYTFPPGSIITAGQYLTLAKNRSAFVSLFGTNAVAFDEFPGTLALNGETLTLLIPGTNGAPDVIIDRVRYEAQPPWSRPAASDGSSLQAIDTAQDNARVSNWKAGFGWQFVSRTGNIVNGTNVLLWLTQAGNAFIDDISLIGPGGTNVLVNGSFESGLAPWIVGTNYSSSAAADGISHSGTRSLFLNGVASGGTLPNHLLQQILDTNSIPLNTNYTLSFYALYNTNSVTVNMRTLPGNNLAIALTTAPVQSTPGALNLFAQSLPPYDPLWLNEVQPNNAAGIMDNNGEREPWIELYNAGATPLSLDGYYLADNYDTNLTRWQFPAGSAIAPGEFKVVWADGQPAQTSGTNLHTSFRLPTTTGSIALVRLVNDMPQITDYLTYSGIGPNLSYGDYPDGQPFNRVTMFTVTPRGTNIARNINVFINEWMAANTNLLADPADADFDDWFELFNAGTDPVDLGGYFLTDDLADRNKYMIPANGQYVIPPDGFLLVWADGETGQNDPGRPDLHAGFNLRAAGESIGLFTADGSQIDAVSFLAQSDDVSEGRFADGAPSIYPMAIPTPRSPNTLGGGGNHPPALAAIASRTIRLGQTVNFVAAGTDPDAPPQVLAYSLDAGAPAGAGINAASGAFAWTPLPGQAPSTNNITVRVRDNGVPQLSATRAFTVVVLLPPKATVSLSGNSVTIGFDTIPGRTYRVEYKVNLTDPVWTQLAAPVVAGGTVLTVNDSTSASAQRFYRIVQLD